MREFSLSIYLSVCVFLNLNSPQAAALSIEQPIEARDPYFKSCLCVESKDEALCAEGNVVSFFYHNRETILALKQMGVLDEKRSVTIDLSKVREHLLKIWTSDTNVAVHFRLKPKTTIADFSSFQEKVWADSYMLRSDEVSSLTQLKQMLNYISALFSLSQEII